jgi:EAL domain-containing protein (putative c-di-GMP-specific phosphodiesterase class I)
MVQHAKNLGLELVTEGIETEVQRAFRLAAGCSVDQGFVFPPDGNHHGGLVPQLAASPYALRPLCEAFSLLGSKDHQRHAEKRCDSARESVGAERARQRRQRPASEHALR